ncbi:MAG: hypothetical protein KKF46_02030 [Nanoarchaeota archaeon]|nr:hypothetical protein [Nanoarchaeota archaeon]MBU1321112.1 hypothetical protein [Nanoarchaeota archaeon]MBU1597488.1 hypothetical protein [Nanoarchaeota archaeon]MBU2441326.1 hypothetical protein [Nanoarchaeota archaeon]
MIEEKINETKENKEITRRDFLDLGMELFGGVIMAGAIIYFLEKEEKDERELEKENLILKGYSQEVAEEIARGKRFYLNIQTKEDYHRIRGEAPKTTYEKWLENYDENMRISLRQGLFQDKFGKYYFRELTKPEYIESRDKYRNKHKLTKGKK